MGKHRFAESTKRFSGVPNVPCIYAVELRQADRVLVKVGVSGSALGRMMSLQSEAVRCHGAVIDRIAIFRAKTSKAAYETETKVVKALAAKCLPIGGRREFFDGVSFEEACLVTSESAGVPVWVDVGVQRQAA